MGGEGSGRKPDVTNQLIKQIQEERTPIANLHGDSMYLPNYSGVQAAALKTSTPISSHDPVTVTDSSTINFTLTGQNITASTIDSAINHTSLLNIGTNTHAQIDTAVTASTNHIADNTQAHSDYLLNSAADVGVGLTLTGDNSSADTAYVPMVLYNTDATPPAASGFPIGTLYIKYTP